MVVSGRGAGKGAKYHESESGDVRFSGGRGGAEVGGGHGKNA